ncbi:DNA primase family protein [Paraburkholderia graminis]|uniref:DNA primase family protein n=1 Tax=Paraburkholderia graminis TaxID=60548 RepID=UPI0038BACBEB
MGKLSELDLSMDPFADGPIGSSAADLQSVKVARVIAKLSEVASKTGKRESCELKYAQSIADDPDWAVAQRDENVSFYRWQGNYWKPQTKHEAQKHAFTWLETHEPGLVSAKLATQCSQSAQFKAAVLPGQPAADIVPLQDCWIVVNANGTLSVRKPDRSVGVTYQILASLNASGTTYTPAPVPGGTFFHSFLLTSLPNREVRNLVQEYCGYTLLNDTRFQVAQVWQGQGSNGKSVLLKIMQKIHQKSAAIRLDNMEKFGLQSLVDASLAVAAETPKRGINEQVLKACITSDPVVIEAKQRNEFTYHSTAKWIIACNRFPHINDETDGVWRRLQIIDWNVQFDKRNRIERLDELIIERELHHVVNWCLEGLQRLLRRGSFDEPQSVLANTMREKESSNTVLAFSEDYSVGYSEGGKTLAKDAIYEKYLSYCEECGHTPCGNVEFWSRMRAGFPHLKETKKREGGRQKRHVNLAFFQPEPEDMTTQEEINEAFK